MFHITGSMESNGTLHEGYIVQSGLTSECVVLSFFGFFYLMILKHGSPGANETIESEIEGKEELSKVY